MIRIVAPFYNGFGINPEFAGNTLVTLATSQTITADKTFTGGKVKITTHLVIPVVAPGTPEDGSFYWTT